MILLSFDIEEFDTPLEHGCQLPFEEQMNISKEGTSQILKILREHQAKATFFCTANFAQHAPELIREMLKDGHEVASHGFYHTTFEVADLKKSKEALEEMIQQPVTGYRMARMMPVEEKEIYNAGYKYNSSLNPTFIPGRYNNLGKPRTYFYKENVLQIPASVTPFFRFPLFWLSYHNLPARVYRWLASWTLRKDKYIVIYFHPWEFTNLGERKELNLPFIITNQSGEGMIKRLGNFIDYFHKKGQSFTTFTHFIQERVEPKHG